MVSHTPPTSPRRVVEAATSALYAGDAAALADYVSVDYIEHAQQGYDGLEGLQGFATSLPTAFRYELHRILTDDDLVVTHGVYFGFSELPLQAFDIWRVADGSIVEHWDAVVEVPETELDSTMGGRTDVQAPDRTPSSKALVVDFITSVLVGGEGERAGTFLSSDVQSHEPQAANRLTSLASEGGQGERAPALLTHTRLHQVVAEGEFVFTRSKGVLDGPVSVNQLWRTEEGEIVELWEVIEKVSDELPHDNGVF